MSKSSSGLRRGKREGCGAVGPGVRKRSGGGRPGLLLVAFLGLPLAACGGDGPVEPPPPPPPPGPPPPPEPGVSLSLQLAELEVLTEEAQIRSFKLEAAPSARRYLVAVHSAAQGPGSFDLQLRARGPEAPGVSATVIPAPSPARAPSLAALPPELREAIGRDLAHLKLQENMLRELRRVNPRPARPASGGGGSGAGRAPAARLSVSGSGRAVPQVGDTLDFRFTVQPDLTVSCEVANATPVTSVVRAVGERFVLAADTAVADGFSQADWDDLNVLLDDVTFPVDSSYYGPPADIDGNDRVVVLFTVEVNKLTERGSSTFIGGLFWPGDLADSASCPASNVAELLYLQAPDPEGIFGDEVSIQAARRNARSVTAHEFQHLLTAEQRVILGNGTFLDLEDVWLSEALAHVAEEVVGLKVVDLAVRQNLTLDETTATPAKLDAFNIHQLSNFFRLAFHLQEPHRTPAFGVEGTGDPGGEESLRMRGNAWIFLRWLADRHAPAGPEGIVEGSGEQLLFQALSTGGPSHLTGVSNVLQAVREVGGDTVTWRGLLSEYEAALALDDDGPAGLPAGVRVLTWDLRAIYLSLHESNLGMDSSLPFTRPFPLEPSVVTMSASTNEEVSFSLNAFTARYFDFRSSGPAAEMFVELTSASGVDVPADALLQVTVVRVQ